MHRSPLYRAAVVTLASVLLGSGVVATVSAQAAEVLTNQSVVQMVTGRVPKDLVLTKIRTTKNSFDLTPTGLVGLNLSKVPQDVMKAMLQAAPSGAPKETLNNDAIIKMVTGSLSKDVILMKIQASNGDYDLTTSGIINLNQNKVSQDVVKAMMNSAGAASAAPPPPAPAPRRKP